MAVGTLVWKSCQVGLSVKFHVDIGSSMVAEFIDLADSDSLDILPSCGKMRQTFWKLLDYAHVSDTQNDQGHP